MKFKSFLIKYAEIGVKGKNRFLFEDALVRQINLSLKNIDGQFHVYKEWEESMWMHKITTMTKSLMH